MFLLCPDDDIIDAVREQLSVNVAAMDKSEEVSRCRQSVCPGGYSLPPPPPQSYVWLDVELERIVREFSHTRAPRGSAKPAAHLKAREGVPRPLSRGRKKVVGGKWRRGSVDGLVGVARHRGIPWRTAARTAHRWWVHRGGNQTLSL